MMKISIKPGKCMLCHNPDDAEGIEVRRWFVRIFICKGCMSRLFRHFGEKN